MPQPNTTQTTVKRRMACKPGPKERAGDKQDGQGVRSRIAGASEALMTHCSSTRRPLDSGMASMAISRCSGEIQLTPERLHS